MNQPEHAPEDPNRRLNARLARREDAKTNPLTLARQAHIEANRALWAKIKGKGKPRKPRTTPPAPPAPDAAG